MAANQEENNNANTPFPNPPSFWHSFTEDNIAAYEALKVNPGAKFPSDLSDELKNLRPPTPPITGEYRIFGEKRSLAAPLKDLPEETPFLRATEGTESSPQHLLNLTRSLMLSYLELLHIMAINPAPPPYGIKWEDLRDLFKNAHHGLNTYRPWQARDALIKLLEQTKANAEAEIEGVQVLKVKVDRVLRDVARNCEQIAGESEDRPEQDADAMTGIEYGKQVGMADNSPTNGVVNATGEDLQERRLWTMMAEESDE